MVFYSAESCVGPGTKERGGDTLSRKEPRLPESEHSRAACVIAHEDSATAHLFGQMAEEGVRTVLRDFSDKVQ